MPPKGKRTKFYAASSSSNMPEEHIASSIPSEQPHVPNRPSHAGRESSRTWTVQAIDKMQAYGKAEVLLSGACGRIVNDCKNVPISYERWDKVHKSYKTTCFNTLKTSEEIAKRYCLLTMARRYRNGKSKLWHSTYDSKFSRDQLIDDVPTSVPQDQWSSFVDYHLTPSYKEEEIGRPVSRGELYIATHKRKDGSYANEETKAIVEQIHEELSQSTNSIEISTNDAVAKVLGPEHSGRVRGLGLGGLPSIAFGLTTGRFNPIGSTFSSMNSAESSKLKEEVITLKTKLTASEETVKTLQTVMLAYIQMKEGRIPLELDALLGMASTPMNEGSEAGPTPRMS
ncbi:uncharacterized protein LOC133303365 [Gastrolobium bilobum]|uniref:uncharacterized protein LOC133303365 n=1 Tax=Gastrolobium bilobum TaxID=150636 RepID=UPI002AAF67C3|nr:uncharacterized protein LOC133303365 [Gastrolobium bilobum]